MADQWWMVETASAGVSEFTRQFADAIRAHGREQRCSIPAAQGRVPLCSYHRARRRSLRHC
jgi:hypothetical protein